MELKHSDRPSYRPSASLPGTFLRMIGRIIALTLLLAFAVMFAACASATTGSASAPNGSGSAPAKTTGASGTAAGGKVFVTSLYPQYLAAAQIAQGVEGVSVVNLTGTLTGDLHDYQLTPGNMKTLERADAFIINGGIETYLDTVIRALPKLNVLKASEGIELTNGNPHVWVSISLMMKQVENIARGMASADPAHKDAYDQRARAYLARLQALRDRMHATIDPLPKYPIITVHEAFPYFAREFGLEIAGVVEREPESEPSAAELAATIRLIREKNVRAVFAEPQYPSAAAERVAREAGVRLYTLDPASMGDLNNLDTYLEIMEKNRQVLAEAFK